MADDAPTLSVDDDWKKEAQAEKAKLKEQSAPEAAEGAPGSGPAGAPQELGFSELVRMLASQALMYMGQFPDPQTGKAMVALDLAKAHIDLLGVLDEKTKGNLDDEESTMLTGMLHELRASFVELSRAIQQAQAEGRIGADGTINMGGDPADLAGGTPGGSGAPGF